MRLWIFSDLHLVFSPVNTPLDIPEADICVCAGDIHVRGPNRSLEWLAENVCPHMPVVFVCGNHEFYHASVVEGIFKGAEAAAAFPNLHFLENGFVEIDGIMFAGATLWTDFEVMGDPRFAMQSAENLLNDYSQIGFTKKPFTKLRAYHTVRMHRESKRFLQDFLDQHGGRRTVVVTHHAPSRRAIAPQFESDITSAAFVSDLDEFILERGTSLWVHGHVHHQLDYRVGDTRLVCNPRGYPDEPSFKDFDFKLVVQI